MTMKLCHTGHDERGLAVIFKSGGTPNEAQVGRSRREAFPLGGYVYTITDMSGTKVYSGNRMSEGLDALRAHLEKAATPWIKDHGERRSGEDRRGLQVLSDADAGGLPEPTESREKSAGIVHCDCGAGDGDHKADCILVIGGAVPPRGWDKAETSTEDGQDGTSTEGETVATFALETWRLHARNKPGTTRGDIAACIADLLRLAVSHGLHAAEIEAEAFAKFQGVELSRER